MKTNKSVMKRFKVTAKGKLKIRSMSGHRHLMSHKSSKRKRQLKDQPIYSSANAYKLKKMMVI